MNLIVEDGTGLADANCYCSLAYFDEYIGSRGLTTAASDEEKEAAIFIAANDWIDGEHTFKGAPLNYLQGMVFPTDAFVGLPKNISQANAQAAWLQLNKLLLVDTSTISTSGLISSETKSLKSGMSKSTTYAEGSQQTHSRILPKSLERLVQPFLLLSEGFGGVVLY